jgi:hypothetical protein
MELTISAEELARINKSNKAMEVLATLPANQRATLIEGFVAALQLSGNKLTDMKQRTVAFTWWTSGEDE